jgi:hypothetical protein
VQGLLDILRKLLRWPSPSMVVAVVALFLAASGGAYAVSRINGQRIKNGSIAEAKLKPKVQNRLNHAAGQHWGIIARNTIGSGVAALRPGPYGSYGLTGPATRPPLGVGSLGIQVSDDATSQSPTSEKISFGNEVDFYGDPVSGLSQAGFRVFQTGENATIGLRNMPNISLEINPNVAGVNYTQMVWIPDPAPVVNRWSGYLDAATTGDWYFTNSAVATATGCTQALTCSLADAKQALVDENDGSDAATIDTIAVSKGRDHEWVGAVDGLRINNKLYDFEPYGVVVTNAT